MSSRPIANAIQCPVCHTWVENVTLCSWCSVELATGSWRSCDPLLAARTLRRLPASRFEEGTSLVELQPCGTTAAYMRHLRHGEEPCRECRAANAHDKRIGARRRRAEKVAA